MLGKIATDIIRRVHTMWQHGSKSFAEIISINPHNNPIKVLLTPFLQEKSKLFNVYKTTCSRSILLFNASTKNTVLLSHTFVLFNILKLYLNIIDFLCCYLENSISCI